MRIFGAVLLAALPFIAYSSALAADLQNTLKEVPEESLRAALEKTLAPKYREGVFEHNEKAIEALQSEDPELANKVIDAAKHDLVQKLELLKRQNNVTTTVVDSSVVVVSNTVTTIASVETTTIPAPSTTAEQSSPCKSC